MIVSNLKHGNYCKQKNIRPEESCSVEQMLAVVLDTGAKGIAVAVNQTIVSKSDWPGCTLRHGDQVILIKATQGG